MMTPAFVQAKIGENEKTIVTALVLIFEMSLVKVVGSNNT